jgi:hypothetical protein
LGAWAKTWGSFRRQSTDFHWLRAGIICRSIDKFSGPKQFSFRVIPLNPIETIEDNKSTILADELPYFLV